MNEETYFIEKKNESILIIKIASSPPMTCTLESITPSSPSPHSLPTTKVQELVKYEVVGIEESSRKHGDGAPKKKGKSKVKYSRYPV